MIADIETLYARLGERDYEAVMSYLADDIVWIVADNSPLADRSPYHGIAEVRSGVFERLTAGFDKLIVMLFQQRLRALVPGLTKYDITAS